ncbi:MAG: flagellar basal-body MS-ring/collar protein FliF [Vibrionaceae bacterium]
MVAQSDNTELAVSGGAGSLQLVEHADDLAEISSSDTATQPPIGNIDMVRQLILVAAVVIAIILASLIFYWTQQPEMRPLNSYETDELIPVLDYLDKQKISYTLDGNTIHVPVKQYSQIKLSLTREGLNAPEKEGDDILMQDMGFGVSQQLERERLKLSRERQLASAIEKIRAVSKAKVLLAMPKQSVFVRHNQETTAAVFLRTRGNASLGQEEVDSIVDLVASSVPGLLPEKVTITDQHGRLLNSGNQNSAASMRRKEYELERKQEKILQEKIDAILLPVLGFGKFTSQVDISMDFGTQEETRKVFDPVTAATRSEYTKENYSNGEVIAGIPGALSNQPPADASIPENVRNLKNGTSISGTPVNREATRNFELDTTIRHKRSQSGVIARQTVSVAIDYVQGFGEEKDKRVPVSDAELEKIRRLLMGGIGFSEQRGDVLEVVAVSFAEAEAMQILDVPIWEHPNFNDWVRWLGASLVIIALLLILVRPALKKLINSKHSDVVLGPNGELLGADGLPLHQDDDIGLIGSDLDGSGEKNSEANMNLPNLRKDDELLKAVRALVASEPDLAAQVVKGWMRKDG